MRDGIEFFRSPSQLATHPPRDGERFRLGGLVEEGSVARDGEAVRFTVTDGGASVPVVFAGLLPDLFREGQGVIATGRLEGGTFTATEVLARHDESYMPKEVADALKEQGLFRYGEGVSPEARRLMPAAGDRRPRRDHPGARPPPRRRAVPAVGRPAASARSPPPGWDNRTFHLGDDLKVRLPSAARYAAQAEKEHRWLPRLAPVLPLPVPVPLAIGAPGEGYPWPWSVQRWLDGETARRERIADERRFAADLAAFLRALQRTRRGRAGGRRAQLPPRRLARGLRRRDPGLPRRARPRSTPPRRRRLGGGARRRVARPRSGCTATSPPATCCCATAGSPRSSTSAAPPSATRPATWSSPGRSSPTPAARPSAPRCRPTPATWARARGWALWKALLILARGGAATPPRRRRAQVVAGVLAEHARLGKANFRQIAARLPRVINQIDRS